MSKIKVLSLFDGYSGAMVALKNRGIKVEKYYASEIDEYATQVSEKNFPEITRMGDVTNWHFWESLYNFDFSEIDLLCAGFPCQAWSIAGKQKGLDDPRGQLAIVLSEIFTYAKKKNPKLKFLFENVRMKKENLNFLDNLFEVEHIKINSNLLSAQNRLRCYWTNIPNVTQPEDKGILLKDIVHEYADFLDIKTKTFNINPSGKGINGNVYSVNKDKSNTLTTNKGEGQKISIPLNEYIVPFDKTLQILNKEVERGKVGYFRKDSQANRVYYIHDKAVTLCGEAGGGAAKMGQYLFGNVLRVPEATKQGYTDIQIGECVDLSMLNSKTRRGRRMKNKSNTLTTSNGFHLFGCITPDRINKRQNGQRFSEGKKFYTLTAQDKHGVLVEGYIRKLTPIECERLMSLPDNYTDGVSNSQRYKMCGNGWEIETISHIMRGLIKCN